MEQGDRVIENRCRVTTCPRWRVTKSQKKSKYVKCDEAVWSKSEKEASADGSPGNESSILVHVYVQYGVISCNMHYRRSQPALVLTVNNQATKTESLSGHCHQRGAHTS